MPWFVLVRKRYAKDIAPPGEFGFKRSIFNGNDLICLPYLHLSLLA
jgi:hypothetical protein